MPVEYIGFLLKPVGFFDRNPAVALDMETGSPGLRGAGRALAVFRAVSDRATDGSVDDEVFDLSCSTARPTHVRRSATWPATRDASPGPSCGWHGAPGWPPGHAEAAITALRALGLRGCAGSVGPSPAPPHGCEARGPAARGHTRRDDPARAFAPAAGTEARAVLNGLVGDLLADQGSSLAVPLTFHDESGEEPPSIGRPKRPCRTPASARRVRARPHVVGLGLAARRPALLRRVVGPDRGVTPVYVQLQHGAAHLHERA